MIPVWMQFISALVLIAVLIVHARVGRNWRRSVAWIASLLPLTAVYFVLSIGILSDNDFEIRSFLGRWGTACLIVVQLSIAVSDIYRWRKLLWKPKQ